MAKDKDKTSISTKYDASKDKCVKDLGPIEDTDLHAAIMSYDKGEEKLSVYRMYGKEKDKKRQVFRLPVNTVRALAQFTLDNTEEVPSIDTSKEDKDSD